MHSLTWNICRQAIMLGGIALFAAVVRNEITAVETSAVERTRELADATSRAKRQTQWVDDLREQTERFRTRVDDLEKNAVGADVVRGARVTRRWREELSRLGSIVAPEQLPLVASAIERLDTIDRQAEKMLSESVGNRQYAVPITEFQANVALFAADVTALQSSVRTDVARPTALPDRRESNVVAIATVLGLACFVLLLLCDLWQRRTKERLRLENITEEDLAALGDEHGLQQLERKTPDELHRLACAMIALHGDIKRNVREQSKQLEQQTKDLEREVAVRRMAEEQVRHAAFRDHLTGLCNRDLLIDRLNRCTTRARRHKDYQFAVLYMGVDRFKEVNDSLGHTIGDRLLVDVARRLETALKSPDLPGKSECNTIARTGSDDFVVLIEGLQAPADAVTLAEQLQAMLGEPFELEGHEVFITVSIGIATSELDYESSEELLRDADVAMYHAKDTGRARHEVFSLELHERATRRLNLATEFRRAVENLDFNVQFQPIVDLATLHTRGFEALVRWDHPERGLISPHEFIDHAEETGLIIKLGDWILDESCRLLAAWRAELDIPHDFAVGVNFSKRQLISPDLVERIGAALESHGLPGHCLNLEVTESAIVTCPVQLRHVLMQLKLLGVAIHMDDFGTGYSSLSQLHRLPVDLLKVDQEFVGTLDGDDESAGIIPTIIMLAHHMDMKVTVEGVESTAQLQQLADLKCDFVQGFHFSAPVPAESAHELILRDWSKRTPAARKKRTTSNARSSSSRTRAA